METSIATIQIVLRIVLSPLVFSSDSLAKPDWFRLLRDISSVAFSSLPFLGSRGPEGRKARNAKNVINKIIIGSLYFI